MITLRDYQIDAIDATYQWMRENPGNPVCVAPTGSGKAVLIAQVCKDAWAHNRRVIVLAHVKELLQQEADKLHEFCPEVEFGVYSAGLKSRDTDNKVLVAGIQSVYNKAQLLGGFDLAIIDEAHRISTKQVGMYRQFLAELQEINPNTRFLGFTATPYRTGEGRIYGDGKLFDGVSFEIAINPLILKGFLSPLVSKSGHEDSLADYDGCHIERGDFVTSEVEEILDAPRIWAACRDVFDNTQDRKSVLIFAVSIPHAEKIRDVFKLSFDTECGLITGSTPAEEREELQRRFRSKELKYLVNVNVLTTGFDAPGIDCVALMRPTASPVLYVQMVGRGFRIAEGKKNCLILDFGGNVMRHGPVTAVNVKDGSPQRRQGVGTSHRQAMKTCDNCHSIIENWYMVCPDCNYEFPVCETTHSDDDVLGAKVKVETFDVRNVKYSVWQKRGDPDAPPTVRVDYEIGWGEFVSEWVCPEHTGYAKEKYFDWIEKRCCLDWPEKADELVAYGEAGALAFPSKITVKKIPGNKYRQIVSVELGPIPRFDKTPAAIKRYWEEHYGNGSPAYSEFSDLGSDEF